MSWTEGIDLARYALGALLVILLPPAIAYWLIVHPFIGFWLRVGDRQVHVGVEDGVNRRATKAHVAYAVTDLGHWRETLAARGVKVVDGSPIPGYDRFEFRDPFGNRIRLNEDLKTDKTRGTSS